MKKLSILIFFICVSSYSADVFKCSAQAEFHSDYEILPNIRINEIHSVTVKKGRNGMFLKLDSLNGATGYLGNGFLKSFKNGEEIHFIDERNDNYIDLKKYYNVYQGRLTLEEDFSLLVRCQFI